MGRGDTTFFGDRHDSDAWLSRLRSSRSVAASGDRDGRDPRYRLALAAEQNLFDHPRPRPARCRLACPDDARPQRCGLVEVANRRAWQIHGVTCRRATLALFATLVIVLAVAPRQSQADVPGRSPAPSDLAALLALARDPPPEGVDIRRFQPIEPAPLAPDAAAIWPLYEFLLAEALQASGDTASALTIHQSIIRWATPDPDHGDPSASTLAMASLWRLLDLRRRGIAVATDRALFDSAFAYWQSGKRNAQGLFDAPPILGALPQLREMVLREMARLAWSLGERHAAYDLLVEYFGIARNGELELDERQIFEEGVSEGAIAKHAVYLAMGKQLNRLGKADQARPLFAEAQQAEEPDIAADARLQLARYLRDALGKACATPELQAAVEAVLAATSLAELRQRALLFRARKHLYRGCPVNLAAFEARSQPTDARIPGRACDFRRLSFARRVPT